MVTAFLDEKAFGLTGLVNDFLRMGERHQFVGLSVNDEDVANPAERAAEIESVPQDGGHPAALG
jgi:hypothetical protein